MNVKQRAGEKTLSTLQRAKVPPARRGGRHMPVQYLSIGGSRDNSKGHSVLQSGRSRGRGYCNNMDDAAAALHALQQLKAALSVALYCHQT